MNRSKHRVADRPSVDVLAITLIKFLEAATCGSPSVLSGLATLSAPASVPAPATLGTRAVQGEYAPALCGHAPSPGPFLAVPADEASVHEVDPLSDGYRSLDPRPLGAGRQAAHCGRTGVTRPDPTPADSPTTADAAPGRPEQWQPIGRTPLRPVWAARSLTVFGAAAAVTAAVAPPVPVEVTGPLVPLQNAAAPTTPATAPLAARRPTMPAPLVAPEQPTLQVADLIGQVTTQMKSLTPSVDKRAATVLNATAVNTAARATSPAAMRKAAVSNALSKLGAPYRWGAAGPNAFDCSGLVKWSFGNAGKALPRASRAMAGVGTAVTRAKLQPGDLVFFYQPISHVGIYIGNDKIVHASQKGQPVKISDMSRMRFTKAVRV
jgi:peptidoglycan DL-endopeptidase CwlO